jgi:hypothetical protein
MSDDRTPPISEEWVAERRRQYTDPDGPFVKGGARGEAALRQFEVMVAEARLTGALPAEPPPPPLDPRQQAFENVLARYPEPQPFPEIQVEHQKATFARFGAMTGEQQSRIAQQVAKDVNDYPSELDGFSRYNAASGTYATGPEIVDAMIEAAEPAVRAQFSDQKEASRVLQLLRLDRRLLQQYVQRGRAMAARAEVQSKRPK